jgi:hypothetical protein
MGPFASDDLKNSTRRRDKFLSNAAEFIFKPSLVQYIFCEFVIKDNVQSFLHNYVT